MNTAYPKLVLSLAIASALAASQAQANDAPVATLMDEVSVSVDFRPSSILNTPASVSTVSEVQIQDRGAQHLENVINLAPNVNSSGGSSRARFFQIRGIGERSQFISPINPSVGMMIDGVDFSGMGGAATLFDIEQIEILRGPQGTRYGANAMAGMIKLQSNAPSEQLEAKIEANVADFNTRSLGVAVGGPLVKNKLLGRIALHKNESDGYIKNTFLNRDDTQNIDELTARARLRLLATDDLTFDFTAFHADIDNGYDGFSLDDIAYETQSDEPGRDTQKSNAFSLNVEWDISRKLRLESTLAHSNTDTEYSYDEDWSHVGLHADEYSSFDQYLRDRENRSAEVRLLSNEDGRIFGGSTDWIVGAYYSSKTEDLTRKYTYLDEDFISDYDTKLQAVFGQLDTALSEKLTLSTGLRFERWEASYDDSDSSVTSTEEDLMGGKVGLAYQANHKNMVYGSISGGYKAGGVNTDGTLPLEARIFDTEYLWSLETGIKSRLLANTLQTRVALFYGKRTDLQVKNSFLVSRADGSTEFTDYFDNAAEGKNYGIEAELNWAPSEAWHLFANAGILQTSFDEFAETDEDSLVGRDQAHAPSYQFALGGEYFLGDQWSVQANVEGKDAFYFSDRHNAKSNAYALLNASLSYSINNWRLSLWGRNLMDEQYSVRGFGSFGNDPRNGYTTETYTQQGEPRIVGLSARWNY